MAIFIALQKDQEFKSTITLAFVRINSNQDSIMILHHLHPHISKMRT